MEKTLDADLGPPLVVDLDGTLLKTDLLQESFFVLIKKRPLYIFMAIFWLIKGRSNLKIQIANRVSVDVAALPYNLQLLKYLLDQKKKGRKIVLATGSEQRLAIAVANHLGVFSEVYGTTLSVNLKGLYKSTKLVKVFGDKKFDYAGDSSSDLAVWQKARKAILVNAPASLERKARKVSSLDAVFNNRKPSVRTFFKAIRVHQWMKNLLIFVPLGAAHQLSNPHLVLQALIAFFAFSFGASCVYLINDLIDLNDDRNHKVKHNRPIACGDFSISNALISVVLLLGASFALCYFLPFEFVLVLFVYYAITLSYTFYLKRVVLVDVLVLAGLYTVRLGAGGAAVSIEPSYWLLTFALFIFLSLAMVKRYAELSSLQKEGKCLARGRGYRVEDLSILSSLGTASGYVAVLVLALYINGEAAELLYKTPQLIWLQCPIMLLWISRVWLKAHRGEMLEDPVIFAIKDRVSQLTVLLMVVVVILAA